VAELVAFASRTITLEPGDVLLTGTPAGVGMANDPPRYLGDGDRVRVEIDGLGELVNTVRVKA
jgi:2-keto-4-pentenoate hydratase/2-oxohepta-3-ene-1,7-dioic acid hydratase in catechol pathway